VGNSNKTHCCLFNPIKNALSCPKLCVIANNPTNPNHIATMRHKKTCVPDNGASQ
jgi:hypothetical protein